MIFGGGERRKRNGVGVIELTLLFLLFLIRKM